MLASTVQFSNNTQPQNSREHQPKKTLTEINATPRYDPHSSVVVTSFEETLACSLRTQQYADIICSPTSTEAGSNENECLSASTHEQPPDNIVSETVSANQPSTCVDIGLENAP